MSLVVIWIGFVIAGLMLYGVLSEDGTGSSRSGSTRARSDPARSGTYSAQRVWNVVKSHDVGGVTIVEKISAISYLYEQANGARPKVYPAEVEHYQSDVYKVRQKLEGLEGPTVYEWSVDMKTLNVTPTNNAARVLH